MSNFAPVRNCPKCERKAKFYDIRSIGHLLTNFRKISLFSVALNMDPITETSPYKSDPRFPPNI